MPLFAPKTKAQSTIYGRCRSDENTKLRLKYAPFYDTFEAQKGSRVWKDGQELVLLSSNDYLGLTEHPKVLEAGQKALRQWGSSSTGARVANGGRQYHLRLEEKLADFLGKEAAHVHSAGYLSCMSAIQPFAQRGDLILVDRNVHSSLWSGIHNTNARVEKFSHNKPASLTKALSFEKPETPKILVFEGVYSMEGHIAPVPDFLEASTGQNVFTVMDDAHGVGVLGNQGRGTAEHFGATDQLDLVCGSLSKALASVGGYVAGDRCLIEYLRSYSKQTLFSAAISPVQAACADAALDILQTEPEHLEQLWQNTRAYRKILEDLNLDTWGSETPAIPVVLGDKVKVYYFRKALMKKGVFTTMSIAPAVPPGKDLIRSSISARHTAEDFKIIADAFAYAVKKVL
ncbi:MAG: aminotransferase class I/II-fold pyridoxal phosphate-dependent enzyme [Opitutales bacterium]|nr:aminotransferase class I/II-fold pyridoxal phosphate-dependent enzyme [Opitutales bacterium]MCH8539404.1 aminotransferase class I/II-fold pyridoxal phosphate-dependent enzyme [Opitutales bacterium]